MSAQRLVDHLLEADSDDIDPRAYLNSLPRRNWDYKIEWDTVDYPKGQWAVHFIQNGEGCGMLTRRWLDPKDKKPAERAAKKWVQRFNDRERIHPFPQQSKTLSVWNWYGS
jgi:hypothetical protein